MPEKSRRSEGALRERFSLKQLTYFEGSLCALMVSFGESSAYMFLAQAKISAMALGILSTLPLALGALAQAAVPRLFRFPSPVVLTLAAVCAQVAGLVIMGCALLPGTMHLPLMALGLCLYWGGGMSAAPPWQEWMSRLVASPQHNAFFAGRAGFVSLALLLSYLTVGWVLQGQLTEQRVAFLLFLAAVTRLCSLVLLLLHPRPVHMRGLLLPENLAVHAPARAQTSPLPVRLSVEPPINVSPVLSPALSRAAEANAGGNLPVVRLSMLCVVAFFFRFAVHTSAPFYGPYMLVELSLSEFVFACLNAAPLLVRFMMLKNWGKLLDEKQVYEGFCICLVGIIIIPSLWTVSSLVPYLFCIQLLSGVVWSGYELVSVLYVQSLFPGRIMQSLAMFLAAGSFGAVAGGFVGGLMRDAQTSYADVFHISGALRLVTGCFFLWYLRSCQVFRFRTLRIRSGVATLLSVRPVSVALSRLVSRRLFGRGL